MAYLAAAYGVLWAVSFGLVVSLLWRQQRLRADLAALQAVLADGEEDPRPRGES